MSQHKYLLASSEIGPLASTKAKDNKSILISSKFKRTKKVKSKNFKLFKKRNLESLQATK